jgi:conjugative relaxase-like TrwC/TraI family protein
MISIHTMRSAKAVSHYFERDDSYYAADGTSQAQSQSSWWGKGAERLGLEGPVEKAQFDRLLNGELPNGQEIQAGAGGQRRPGVDVTMSAPKSLSLLVEIGRDEALRGAHARAVDTTLAFLEKEAMFARVTEGGETRLTQTGNAIVAKFDHNSSRALDPQVHTHTFF